MTKLLVAFLIVFLSGCSSDFDKTCEFFVELSQSPGIDWMSANDKNIFIMERMNTLEDGDAKAAWNAITYAVPEEKYELFEQVAHDSEGGKDWQCSAMKVLVPSIKPETTIQKDSISLKSMGVTNEKEADFKPKKSTLPLL
ncbi:hypothetical protein [Litoribrevibacter albus]|uniref:Lipoprotein n=1 Tax=Litoribrevibacter albus TaxID=1473156 RepID=A0AA37SFG9_9GAMM|nr:hypothetical protein [Litoribrevibacter albus]GLQ33587.1 hypothetical protein GCM10007876_40670 [Litoribrevibacter albus]